MPIPGWGEPTIFGGQYHLCSDDDCEVRGVHYHYTAWRNIFLRSDPEAQADRSGRTVQDWRDN